MNFNPQFSAIGQAFANQYYQLFDNPAARSQLAAFYHVSLLLTWYYFTYDNVSTHRLQ